jgi:putative Mg2+ transporter-C (MgtC) family protein
MVDPLAKLSVLQLLSFYLPKILVATVCGGVVGLEREIKHKVVGIKTNILICVGATIFTSTALLVGSQMSSNSDPGRMLAQLVSGIGFLGAGSIFRTNDRVVGLTSAALIWVLGAMGGIIGSGGYLIAIILTAGLVLVTVLLALLERRYFKEKHDV